MIVALDAATGQEAWRFNTIARPGEPGGNSWNGLPLEKRNGASVWTAGSYDPTLNLVFFGAAQTYDTGPLVHPSKEPGINNDALYTDTTLAFDPDTGKLMWHFQHMPNDQWDLDWAFERQLINLPREGRDQARGSDGRQRSHLRRAGCRHRQIRFLHGSWHSKRSHRHRSGHRRKNNQSCRLLWAMEKRKRSARTRAAPRAGFRARSILKPRSSMCRWSNPAWI